MSKILILGGTGMLGSQVVKTLNELGHDTTFTYRPESVEVAKKLPGKSYAWLAESDIGNDEYDYLINCIGVIKPFMKQDPIRARILNTIFPWTLATNYPHLKVIHITTDCVFSGLKGSYFTESDLHDALDDYGKSKSLGEPNNCMVIRTSIIGEEVHKNASLIEWAKSQKGKEVNGFTNHFWNGITTKTYAEVIDTIIKQDLYERDLFHVFSPDTVSKFDLLHLFNEKFDLNLSINATEGNPAINRTLGTGKQLNQKLGIKTIQEQVTDL